MLATKYLLLDPEIDNFTYDLANEGELAHFLSERPQGDPRVHGRIQHDLELSRSLRRRLRRRRDRNHTSTSGRRVGWYVIARALGPRVVVETGIHDGLGSAILLRALQRNVAEGEDGRLISFDVNPQAGCSWASPFERAGKPCTRPRPRPLSIRSRVWRSP